MGDTFRSVRVRTGKLDSRSGAALAPLFNAAWRDGIEILALDLRDVDHIDSLGISALVVQNRRRPTGARIVLCALTDYVRDVIEVTQLFRVFEIYDSDIAARAALSV